MEFYDVEWDFSEIFYSEQQICDCIVEICWQIEIDYVGIDLFFVGVLCGVVMVMVDFVCEFKCDIEMDWMVVFFYGNSIEFSGVVWIVKDFDIDFVGCNVLIVEDIVDFGLIFFWLKVNFESCNLVFFEICVLLCKFEVEKVYIDVKYVGFDILNVFVVGYGFDYVECYCNLCVVVVFVFYVYV